MPNYTDHLPAFDPTVHLTTAELRAVERKYGYEQTARSFENKEGVNLTGPSGMKIAKAQYETQMFVDACTRFTAISRDHPPYGLPNLPAMPSMVLAPEPMPVTVTRLTAEQTPGSLHIISLKALQALSDFKMQLLINELLGEVWHTPAFQERMQAGNEATRVASAGRTSNWKDAIHSAASNAKRSEFIIFKQILIQWMATVGRLPTRAEFLEVAAGSQQTLEMLATTHQAVFKPLNGLIIKDEALGSQHQLVRNDGRGQIALRKRLLHKLDVERGQPKTRTMCAALLARDAEGVSLLEHSYAEDTRMVADMLFDGEDAIPGRIEEVAREQLPEQSVHMFLKLAAYEVTPANEGGPLLQ